MSARIAIALGLAVAAASCGGGRHAETPKAAPLPTLSVRTALVTEAREALSDEVVGTIRARNATAVSASIMGTVRALKVQLGSRVRRGDVLVQLAAGEIDAKASQARAALDRADLDLSRAQHLVVTGAITKAEYDDTAAQHRVAAATFDEADTMHGYTLIRAPISGVITEKQCEQGDMAMPGKPLLVIESLDALRLEAAVPEALAHRLRAGDSMPVHIDALERDLVAKLSELDPSAEPDSRTVLVKLDLPQLPELRPGMFGRLLLPTGEMTALTVPRGAIVERGQMELVYVVEGGATRLKLVRTGKQHGDRVELLAGLSSGEIVVAEHPERLVDGQLVAVAP